jgi:DNA (cytosine-5)-methyltransferase 1
VRLLDLFAGIGGFSLAAHWMGWETVAFVEKEPFCQKVLAKNFPGVPIYDDVRTFPGESFRGRCDIITGGFPCQDISIAGKHTGIAGERSALWSELCRIIGEVRPRYAIVENVGALLGRGMWKVLGDLSAIGYDAEWDTFYGYQVGLPHSRRRVFIVAYPSNVGRKRRVNGTSTGLAKWRFLQAFSASGNAAEFKERFICETRSVEFVRKANGVPGRVDRVFAIGNAIVPQIAYEIFKAIKAAE